VVTTGVPCHVVAVVVTVVVMAVVLRGQLAALNLNVDGGGQGGGCQSSGDECVLHDGQVVEG
jgi:hypothetical protein